jgi:hypothetical protein
VPEGLSTGEVDKQIAEHREQANEGDGKHETARHERLVSIIEAALLSIVALMAAWSGYSAAKWGTESSLSLAKASAFRSKWSLAEIQTTQTRTLDSVSFNAAEGAFLSHNVKLFALDLRRMRPGYRPAVMAWLALHPLKNPKAPPDPSYMPQYVIPSEAQAKAFNAQSLAYFSKGESAASTADKYVRLTVLLAAVLFLVGIGSRFPVRQGRYVLLVIACSILVLSVVQLAALRAPP